MFDGFEGLPDVDEYNRRDFHARQSTEWVSEWSAGRYSASLERVKSNIKQYGYISVCRIQKGWPEDTLIDENRPPQIAFTFTDVDLASSARECLVSIWPKIAPNGVYFSHDIAFLKVLEEITDERIWQKVLSEPLPLIFGAGYGLSDSSPHLGVLVKGQGGRRASPEYINSLTLEK